MPAGVFRVAADAVVAFHLAFVLFVVLGGLFALRWRWAPLIHIPVALWGAAISLVGWLCPLTPLENYLRRRGGSSTYQGEFIEHYLLPLLYPTQLTRELQIATGVAVLVVNALVYWRVMRARSHR
jgi:hypothetical protein